MTNAFDRFSMGRLRSRSALITIVVLVLAPLASADGMLTLEIYSDGSFMDGGLEKEVYVLEWTDLGTHTVGMDGLLTFKTGLACFAPTQTTDLDQPIYVVLVHHACVEPPVEHNGIFPEILLVAGSVQPVPPCATYSRCIGAGFYLQVLQNWGGTLTFTLKSTSGEVIATEAFVLPYDYYGMIHGKLFTSLTSDYVVEVRMVDVTGHLIDVASRSVNVVDLGTPHAAPLVAEYTYWPAYDQYLFIGLSSWTPVSTGCAWTEADDQRVDQARYTAPEGAEYPQDRNNFGFWSSPPDEFHLASDTICDSFFASILYEAAS